MNHTQLRNFIHNLNGVLPLTVYGDLDGFTLALAGSEEAAQLLKWVWTQMLTHKADVLLVGVDDLPAPLPQHDIMALHDCGVWTMTLKGGGETAYQFSLNPGPLMFLLSELLATSYEMARTFLDRPKDYTRYVLYSAMWSLRRSAVIARAGGCCEGCGRRSAKFQVHHLTYDRLYNEPLEDLQALCPKCHKAKHLRTSKVRPPEPERLLG